MKVGELWDGLEGRVELRLKIWSKDHEWDHSRYLLWVSLIYFLLSRVIRFERTIFDIPLSESLIFDSFWFRSLWVYKSIVFKVPKKSVLPISLVLVSPWTLREFFRETGFFRMREVRPRGDLGKSSVLIISISMVSLSPLRDTLSVSMAFLLSLSLSLESV